MKKRKNGRKGEKRRDGGKREKRKKLKGKKKKVFLPFSSETELLLQDLISKAEFN